ncbi:hypothetical protein HS088_TW15G00411 [Tripterygium wilfordii]|uniref:Sphingomyelin phosphodiesterase 4 n=1 Tax=Tripterygium wilfordii TaxID=458696 RepID=A0A7J7CLI5_TRIWF|nr:uncharacterized protein LOC120015886 [Tripterygium wilfordii]KAF5734914.1 hypothetical protein HS088_TW15G00411 [Tripterygium wilfordii]
MLSHSYTVDSLSKSQDLAAAITASSTPAQIISTCASIESILHSHTPDQSRHFFSLTFPTLICKLYGFDEATSAPGGPQHSQSQGWIDTVLHHNDSDLAAKVFNLLAPNGVLFNAISAVDRLSLVRYVFPIERLPEWARYMLSSDKDCGLLSDLCPLFKGRVKVDSIKGSFCQIQLNVFEYYMFWFAYYPVCRGIGENLNKASTKRSKRFRLEKWTHSIPGFSSTRRESDKKMECDLCARLLYAYLHAFVPVHDLSALQPYRSSHLHFDFGYDGSIILKAEFFINTLINYWLVDNDFSPLPKNACKSTCILFQLQSVLGETPPTSGLGEVLNLFVKYLNMSAAIAVSNGCEIADCTRWRVSSSSDNTRDVGSVANALQIVSSWNSWLQRPLYRYILRTFLFCPLGASIKNVSQVFSVWTTYMQPWMIQPNEFAELDAIVDGSGRNVSKEESQAQENGYSSSWKGYVLCNYLYYSSLVMHFIGFAHKFLHTDPEVMVQMVSKIINILTSSEELVDLIREVETVFHSKKMTSGKPTLNSLYGFVPVIREQLQDWEDGLCESDADGSFLHENWNKDLQLFSNGEDGGQQLLQLFVLRAEAELQANSSDNPSQALQCINSLKEQLGRLFGQHAIKPVSYPLKPKQHNRPRDEIFKPRKLGNHVPTGSRFKGDWMKRPISDDEVALLAKFLVWLSIWLNDILGLNEVESSDVVTKWSYVDVSSTNECGSMETMRMVLCALGSWFLMIGATLVGIMRKHGLRINLRMLASKKIVMILLLAAVFSVMKKAIRMFHIV